MFEDRLKEGEKGRGEENHFMHEKGVRGKERGETRESSLFKWHRSLELVSVVKIGDKLKDILGTNCVGLDAHPVPLFIWY